MVLNVGCGGANRIPDEIDVDVWFDCHPTVQADITALPFKDNTFDKVRAIHVLEHIHDIVGAMNECRRVTKPRGIMEIRVPMFPSRQAIADPTHVRYFIPTTMYYFVDATRLPGIHPWKLGTMKYTDTEIYAILEKV